MEKLDENRALELTHKHLTFTPGVADEWGTLTLLLSLSDANTLEEALSETCAAMATYRDEDKGGLTPPLQWSAIQWEADRAEIMLPNWMGMGFTPYDVSLFWYRLELWKLVTRIAEEMNKKAEGVGDDEV